MAFTIHKAETQQERDAVYRFRYRIHQAELHQESLAVDHDRKMIRDDADDAAVILYVQHGKRLVGSVRIVFGLQSRLSWETRERFETDAASAILGEERVSVTSHLMVEPGYRGLPPAAMLLAEMYDTVLRYGAELNYCLCELTHLRTYQRMGYRQYRSRVSVGAGMVRMPVVLVVRDHGHLKRCDSPFAPVLEEKLSDEGKIAGILMRLYPAFDIEPATCFQLESFEERVA